ncbi:MAG TPA: CBS domain-containing protein [Bradyrhizobium sp.]|nr:CBS domain-containing protein [Stellaceae bacterium]HUO00214.1 CBS domain-containing protein [Bradyrhizobium sp.]
MKVGDIMTRDVVTAGPDTGVEAIARMMLERHIGAVPIVDSERRLVGILSDHDILRHPPKDSPRAWWLRLFDERAVCLEEIATAKHRVARDVMARRVTTVSDDTPVGILGSLMRRRKLKHVPVLHKGKLVGMVSRADLLHALMKSCETV